MPTIGAAKLMTTSKGGKVTGTYLAPNSAQVSLRMNFTPDSGSISTSFSDASTRTKVFSRVNGTSTRVVAQTTTKKFSNGALAIGVNADGTAGGDGEALQFNAHDDFDMGIYGYTIEMWIKTDDARTGQNSYLIKSSNGQFYLRMVSGRLQWSHGPWALSSKLVNDGLWHFVVLQRTGTGTAQMIIDGASQGTSTNTSAVNLAGTNIGYMYIGGDGAFANPSTQFRGFIDELRICKSIDLYRGTVAPGDLYPVPTAAFGPYS